MGCSGARVRFFVSVVGPGGVPFAGDAAVGLREGRWRFCTLLCPAAGACVAEARFAALRPGTVWGLLNSRYRHVAMMRNSAMGK
jgi:hypothetical protein